MSLNSLLLSQKIGSDRLKWEMFRVIEYSQRESTSVCLTFKWSSKIKDHAGLVDLSGSNGRHIGQLLQQYSETSYRKLGTSDMRSFMYLLCKNISVYDDVHSSWFALYLH